MQNILPRCLHESAPSMLSTGVLPGSEPRLVVVKRISLDALAGLFSLYGPLRA
jgi:hypothetical protein